MCALLGTPCQPRLYVYPSPVQFGPVVPRVLCSGPSTVVDVIQPRGPVPAYQQLAEILTERLTRGTYGGPDTPIPSEKDMCAEFGVARETVRKAVAICRERGLVWTVPHRGTYVARRPE